MATILMDNRFSLSLLILGTVFLFKPVLAENRSTSSDQTNLSLTIYNGGRALIRDRRQINLKEKTAHLAVMDVAQKIMPQTVAIDGLDVLEQNYDFDLLTPMALVEKNIGHKVRLARRSKETGETIEWSEGTVLSTNGGVVLQMQDGSLESLNSAKNYHMIFDEVPNNLRITPTLSLLLQEEIDGNRNVDLTYLTKGLSWQSDYVMQLNDTETEAQLDSWITLNNNSGIAYHNAQLQLLAGDVNMQRPQVVMAMMEDSSNMRRKTSSTVAQESIHGYHLYTVPHKTTIKNKQSKQVKLFMANTIPVHKKIEDKAYVQTRGINKQKSKPDQFLLFKNKKPSLGIPLPKGTIRVYGKDQSGNKQFLGEDSINHTALNEDVEIKLGKAFDITVERMTQEYRQLSKKQIQIKREIKVNNGSKEKQTIKLTEIMPSQNWKIKSTTQAYSKASPSSADFDLLIPALTEIVFNYVVVINYP